MNSRLRPSRSDILPNTSAPTISPTRYTDAISPTSVEVMPSVEDLVSSPDTELATVICSPSRIHAPPRPITSRVWNGDQFNRSSRAGIRLRIGFGAASVVVLIAAPSGNCRGGAGYGRHRCGRWQSHDARPRTHGSGGKATQHPPDGGKWTAPRPGREDVAERLLG